ncbi:hypothetical protein AB7W12_03855 [Providencia rettgeri]
MWLLTLNPNSLNHLPLNMSCGLGFGLPRLGGTHCMLSGFDLCFFSTLQSCLSSAVRAWDKHAARPSGVFEPLNGNPAQKNAAAENFIREIFKDPKVVRNDLGGGAFEYRLPSGKGVRYNADGSFNTVLDPKKAIK